MPIVVVFWTILARLGPTPLRKANIRITDFSRCRGAIQILMFRVVQFLTWKALTPESVLGKAPCFFVLDLRLKKQVQEWLIDGRKQKKKALIGETRDALRVSSFLFFSLLFFKLERLPPTPLPVFPSFPFYDLLCFFCLALFGCASLFSSSL